MAIGSSLGITLPTQGSTTTWGTALNTELQKIIDAVEASVPASAITFSADFDLNNYALTSIAHTSYDEQSSAPTELRSLYFNSSGELICIDGSNNSVAITSGGGLSGAGGSITGAGYDGSEVRLNWDNTYFNFYSGSGSDDFADVRMNTLLLRDGSGNAVTLDCPSLSSDYTVTFANAVPGSTAAVQISAAGQLSYSNTFSELITASAGVTCAANQDITLSGTGKYNHGEYELVLNTCAGTANSPSSSYNGTYGYWEIYQGTSLFMPVPLPVGKRIKSIYAKTNSADTGTKTLALWSKSTASASAPTVIATTTGTTSGLETLTLSGLSTTIATAISYVIQFVSSSTDSNEITLVSITYDEV